MCSVSFAGLISASCAFIVVTVGDGVVTCDSMCRSSSVWSCDKISSS